MHGDVTEHHAAVLYLAAAATDGGSTGWLVAAIAAAGTVLAAFFAWMGKRGVDRRNTAQAAEQSRAHNALAQQQQDLDRVRAVSDELEAENIRIRGLWQAERDRADTAEAAHRAAEQHVWHLEQDLERERARADRLERQVDGGQR